MKKTDVLQTGLRLILLVLGMAACMPWTAGKAFAASERSAIEENGVSADTETEGTTKNAGIVAVGEGWMLDTDGCLHILGNVTNTSSYAAGSGVQDGTPWARYKSQIISVDAAPGAKVVNGRALFYRCPNLETADLTNLDTSDVTDMSFLFYFCEALKSVNVSTLSTARVKTMECMFYRCVDLQEIDINNWDTSSVENMSSMFSYCASVKRIGIDKIKTPALTNMEYMFEDCYELEALDLGNFTTSGITSMRYLFGYCRNLTCLDLGNFDTSKVTDMYAMFSDCRKLETVNLSSFDTLNVKNMGFLFDNCRSLKFLDLSNFKIRNGTAVYDMFCDCVSLEEVDISGFDVTEAETALMFENCNSLCRIDMQASFLALSADELLYVSPQWLCVADGKIYSDAESLKKLKGKVKLHANTCKIDRLTNAWYGITVKWSGTDGKPVTLYRRDDLNLNWTEVATVTCSGYYDKTVYNDMTYTYALVYADRKITGGGSTKTQYYIESPKIRSVENRSGSVKVTWDQTYSAEGYFVYRKETQDGTWHMIGSTRRLLYFIDDTVENGVVYYYAVKAFRKDRNTSEYITSASSSAMNTVYVKNNFISEMTEPVPGTLQVKYTKITGCSGYEAVYGTDETLADGITVTITDPASAIAKIPDLQAGRTYYAKVRAYKTVGGYTFFSNWSAVKNLTLEPEEEPVGK